MFTDLFSSLDGCLSIWSWAPCILLVFFLFNKSFSLSLLHNYSMRLYYFGAGNKKTLSFGLFMLILFNLLLWMNILGLSPFTYSMTSSLWFASSCALMMWLLLIFSGYFHSFKKSVAHLVPSGAPSALIPFLVLIESISILIRPLTLTVRLIANISAGHIVLSLIANCLTILNFKTMLVVLLVSVGYNVFEVFVCFIQAYIFTLLLKLYSFEHPLNYSMMSMHLTVN